MTEQTSPEIDGYTAGCNVNTALNPRPTKPLTPGTKAWAESRCARLLAEVAHALPGVEMTDDQRHDLGWMAGRWDTGAGIPHLRPTGNTPTGNNPVWTSAYLNRDVSDAEYDAAEAVHLSVCDAIEKTSPGKLDTIFTDNGQIALSLDRRFPVLGSRRTVEVVLVDGTVLPAEAAPDEVDD
jgi:hypothetical protein